MSDYSPVKGGSILAIAGTINHLHFICSDPFFYKNTGKHSVVAVNISSVKEGFPYDKTCILRAGDHPFIKHKSYVYYKGAAVLQIEKIRYAVEAGEFTVLEDVSPSILKNVLDGFSTSPFTPAKILKALQTASQSKWRASVS